MIHPAPTSPSTSPSSSSSSMSPLVPHPQLLVRWFVQYNPLFSASALCVLGGVWLLSRSLGSDATVGLSVVMEAYQWLVLGAAAVLSRRLLDHRPAAILGLLLFVLMMDPTLQLSALAGDGERLATVLWVTSFIAKARVIEWAFFVRLSWLARALPPIAAVSIAAIPSVRLMGIDDEALVHALLVGVAALAALVVRGGATVTSTRALGDAGQVMFPRVVRAFVGIGAVGVVWQVVNATLAIGPRAVFAPLAALVLVAATRATSEQLLYAAVAFGGMLGGAAEVATPTGIAIVEGLCAAALLAASSRHAPRVFVLGVVACTTTALALVAPGFVVPTLLGRVASSVAFDVVIVLASVPLVRVLIVRRAPSAALALLALHARVVVVAGSLLPTRSDQWGNVLLLGGFALLPLALVAQRRLARLVRDDDEPVATTGDGPSSSAAPMRVRGTHAA